MAILKIPTPLRSYTDGQAEVTVTGANVAEAMEHLVTQYPTLRPHLYNGDGRLRPFVNLFVGENNVKDLQGLETPLEDNARRAADPVDRRWTMMPAAVLPGLTRDEILRYSRHLLIPEVGLEGQRKLKGASALIIGTGGLGSPVSLYLAAAGVGRIGLVDYDVVDSSNLQRQIIHGTSTIGKLKVESARAKLVDLNPEVQVDVYNEPFTSENALRIAKDYDILLDGTDNFPTRYLTNDVAVFLGKPNVYASIYRFDGQVSVFYAKEGPCYRCLFPEPPPPGLVPSCAEGGVLGVLPGTIGTIQATEALEGLAWHWRPIDRQIAALQRARHVFRFCETKEESELPGVRRACGHQGTHRLRGVLRRAEP